VLISQVQVNTCAIKITLCKKFMFVRSSKFSR